MPKSRSRNRRKKQSHKRKQSTRQAPPATQTTTPLLPVWKRTSTWVVSLLCLLASIGTLFQIWPRLAIEESAYLDPANPYTELFTLENNGYIPATDITASAPSSNFDIPGHIHYSNNFNGSVGRLASYLGHGDKVTLPTSMFVGMFFATRNAGTYLLEPPLRSL